MTEPRSPKLDAEALVAIRRVLVDHPRLERAILYGSRAMGHPRPGSDIDLILVGESLGHDDLCDIELALDDLLLPWKFDVSLYHHLTHQALLEHIDREGIVLYERRHPHRPRQQRDYITTPR